MADTKIVGGKGFSQSRGGGGEKEDCCFPQKFVSPPKVKTIFVRADGSDKKGNGETEETALRTIQCATLEIPLDIQGGGYYVIDATGLIDGGPEVLVPNYALPAWKSSTTLVSTNPDSALDRGAVTLRADLRDVPALGADAVIELGDLETTDVGGPIVSSSGTTPILITTTTPHNLVQSPFGIFGVFPGLVQVVVVSGNSQPEANGVFFALVTKPTVDESTTFELYDFDLNPVAGSGAGANGTVTILFVRDKWAGQSQLKLSAPRASWVAGSLKGKMLTGSNDTAIIYDNTTDTLFLASNGEPGVFDGPVRIQEPSCVLQCSDSEVFNDLGCIGGLNIANVDSMALSGIEVRAAGDGSGLLHSSGMCLISECVLEAPRFCLSGIAFTVQSRLIFPSYNQVVIDHDRCLVENMVGAIEGYWSAFHGTVYIQDTPLPTEGGFLGSSVARNGSIDVFVGMKVISTANPVLLINSGGEDVRFVALSIEGGSGDAISVSVPCKTQLFNVGGSGWAGTALVVDTGAQVEVNEFSFVKTDEMRVGELPARTFDDFRTSGPPFELTQFDVTYDPTAGAATKATGTASRVFQKP